MQVILVLKEKLVKHNWEGVAGGSKMTVSNSHPITGLPAGHVLMFAASFFSIKGKKLLNSDQTNVSERFYLGMVCI